MNLPQWVTLSAAVIAVVGTAVNAASVEVLVLITNRYAKSTANILDESRKAREAAEKQAEAAQKSFSASVPQASAAPASVSLLRQQIEGQLGLGRGIVQSATASALSRITYWKSLPLTNLSKASSLPPTIDFLPVNAQSSIEHARRISEQGPNRCPTHLTIFGRQEVIERTKNSSQAIRAGFYDDTPSQAPAYLDFKNVQQA